MSRRGSAVGCRKANAAAPILPHLSRAEYEIKTVPRAKPERVKEKIVRQREFKNIVLKCEDVAEMDYRPAACQKTYRLVVVRKNLSIEKGEFAFSNKSWAVGTCSAARKTGSRFKPIARSSPASPLNFLDEHFGWAIVAGIETRSR